MTEPADLARNLKNARPLAWYRPGRQVEAANYTYELTAPPGKQFAEDFRPALTPQQMLRAGVFEGRYLNDSWGEFPREWFAAGLRAGRLRAIAVTGLTRDPLLPEVPTMAEAGVPRYEIGGWHGLFAPAAIPGVGTLPVLVAPMQMNGAPIPSPGDPPVLGANQSLLAEAVR